METSEELLRAAYGPKNAPLVEIKNVLRRNQNIKPN
jgi:hypothetical protein